MHLYNQCLLSLVKCESKLIFLSFLFIEQYYSSLIHQQHLEFTGILDAESHMECLCVICLWIFRDLLVTVGRGENENFCHSRRFLSWQDGKKVILSSLHDIAIFVASARFIKAVWIENKWFLLFFVHQGGQLWQNPILWAVFFGKLVVWIVGVNLWYSQMLMAVSTLVGDLIHPLTKKCPHPGLTWKYSSTWGRCQGSVPIQAGFSRTCDPEHRLVALHLYSLDPSKQINDDFPLF